MSRTTIWTLVIAMLSTVACKNAEHSAVKVDSEGSSMDETAPAPAPATPTSPEQQLQAAIVSNEAFDAFLDTKPFSNRTPEQLQQLLTLAQNINGTLQQQEFLLFQQNPAAFQRTDGTRTQGGGRKIGDQCCFIPAQGTMGAPAYALQTQILNVNIATMLIERRLKN